MIYYHLPGLFEFYEFYSVFLRLFKEHREYFYHWCEIGSIYGAPSDCIWGGGRIGCGGDDPQKVYRLMQSYGISARLTFSNSLLNENHLKDKKCNELCEVFNSFSTVKNGVIISSDLLLDYLRAHYENLYFVSSTTKVITDRNDFLTEVNREDFAYVVPDFRLNKSFEMLEGLDSTKKKKIEFLCNECCAWECKDRKACYENVSKRSLGIDCKEHLCKAPYAREGYRFSRAMENKGFIGIKDIVDIYAPMGFTNFKIEGRGLGSALLLEFLLYYMTKPNYQLRVREEIYLDSMLDLF